MNPALLVLLAAPLLQGDDAPAPKAPGAPPPLVGVDPARTVLLEQTLAIVNDQVITASQVEAEVRRRAAGRPLAPAEFQKLRAVVFRDLLLDALFREGFRMDGLDDSRVQAIVEQEIQKRIEQHGSMADYLRFLEAQGTTLEDEMADMRRYFTALLYQMVQVGNIQVPGTKGYKASRFVSPGEIARYYEEHRDEFRHERRVRARMIQVRQAPDGGPAEPWLRKVREDVLAGRADFAALAREHSVFRPSTGGLMGWVPERSSFAAPIREVLERAEGPLVSEPFPVRNALDGSELWTLVRVEEVQPAGTAPLAEVQLEIAGRLAEERRTAILEATVRDLRRRCYVWGPEVDPAIESAFAPAAAAGG